jgi:class 3 adenylate cyclase/GAF domain-containing protein
MHWMQRYRSHFRSRTRLQRHLHLAFGFFFLCPVAGLLFFGVRYNLLADEILPYFFLALLVCAWIGLGVLRTVFARVTAVSEAMGRSARGEAVSTEALHPSVPDELRAIVDAFGSLSTRSADTAARLERMSARMTTLRELSELCCVTLDPEEVLYIALERALLLTGSDIGSVLVLERGAEPRAFTVRAAIGLAARVTPGDRIGFDDSIAKYAVLTKSPLLVENIEHDRRFGRANLDHYGAKSFICMPVKTSRDVVGVLTISSRDANRVYAPDDVEALTPLVGNAAFAYESLRLAREHQRAGAAVRCAERTAALLSSSFRDSELLSSVLQELHALVDFRSAAVLIRDERQPETIRIRECFGFGAAALRHEAGYPCAGSLVDQALKQDSCLLVDAPDRTGAPLDEALFGGAGGAPCCIAPLRTGGMVFGALVLIGRSRERLQASRTVAGWVAGGLALAIERNRLLSALTKREQEMETIRQVGGALASSTFDMQKVLRYTMDLIHEVMNVEAGSLLFLENGELEMAVGFNGCLPTLPRVRLKLGQGIAGSVAARGEAVIANDMESSLQFFPVIDDESGFRTRSALCVPMISQGRVIGVIEVLNKRNGPFDAGDRDLLQALAASVCIALENARLYKETATAAAHERDVRRMFQKFVPKEVVERILHGPEGMEKPVIEELKRVTLLNIDIRGFSGTARQMGPQRTVALLNRFFATMGEVVFRYRGIVDKYLGDGFLAVFGAPVSGPEDAENAVQAALEMRRLLAREGFGPDPLQESALHMGISIHTGEVVVGNIGFEKKMDYTVIGEAVNTVFRMQALVKSIPDGIVISDTTLRSAHSRLRVVPLEPPPEVRHAFGPLALYELAGAEDPDGPLRTGRPAPAAEPPAADRLPSGPTGHA